MSRIQTDDGVDELRRHGIRVTPQRLAVYACLGRHLDHPDAETIHRDVRELQPAISLDTVYRSLYLFERKGLIGRVEALSGRARFDGRTDPHPHAVCIDCGLVQDCDAAASGLPPVPPVLPGFKEVHSAHVEYRGVCSACASEGD